jgi:hypothetical protein
MFIFFANYLQSNEIPNEGAKIYTFFIYFSILMRVLRLLVSKKLRLIRGNFKKITLKKAI